MSKGRAKSSQARSPASTESSRGIGGSDGDAQEDDQSDNTIIGDDRISLAEESLRMAQKAKESAAELANTASKAHAEVEKAVIATSAAQTHTRAMWIKAEEDKDKSNASAIDLASTAVKVHLEAEKAVTAMAALLTKSRAMLTKAEAEKDAAENKVLHAKERLEKITEREKKEREKKEGEKKKDEEDKKKKDRTERDKKKEKEEEKKPVRKGSEESKAEKKPKKVQKKVKRAHEGTYRKRKTGFGLPR